MRKPAPRRVAAGRQGPGGLCGQRAGAPGDTPGHRADRKARPSARETEETLRESNVIKQLQVNQFVTVAR